MTVFIDKGRPVDEYPPQVLPCRLQADQQFAGEPDPALRRDSQRSFTGGLGRLCLGHGTDAVEQRQQLQHGIRRFALEYPRGMHGTRGTDLYPAHPLALPGELDLQPTFDAHRRLPRRQALKGCDALARQAIGHRSRWPVRSAALPRGANRRRNLRTATGCTPISSRRPGKSPGIPARASTEGGVTISCSIPLK